MGEDVAQRVVEHVAHVQRAGRIREHFQHVELLLALRSGLRVRGHRRPARPPRRAATSPRLSAGRICPFRLRVQKSLSIREARGSRRGAAAWLPALHEEVPAHCAQRYQPPSRDERSEMSDYTVVKVSDVPDQGPNLGVAPDVEIRFLRNDLGCEDCGVSYARIAPNGKRAERAPAQAARGDLPPRVRFRAHQGRGRHRRPGAVDGRSCSCGRRLGHWQRVRTERNSSSSARRTRGRATRSTSPISGSD